MSAVDLPLEIGAWTYLVAYLDRVLKMKKSNEMTVFQSKCGGIIQKVGRLSPSIAMIKAPSEK